MKTRLEELTVSQLVDLMDGKTEVLGKPGNGEDAARIARDILLEYRAIVDPGAMRTYIADGEESSRAKSSVVIFSVCNFLIGMNRMDEVRAIMEDYGLNTAKWSEKRLAAEMKARLARAQNTLKRIEEEGTEGGKDTDVRRDFDMQTAALMAHFKFQIQPDSMRATLYAHLVARFQRELKAQAEALKKYK